MGEFWLRQLQAAEEAEEAARRLRRIWGADAEAHLSDEARGVEAEDARKARIEDVRRALRWT
jgi:hypothetical protein